MKVLQNPGSLRSGYYIGCAAFIQGVYNKAGLDGGSGNANQYWERYSSSGSNDLSKIPIGALLSFGPVGSNPYGHIGIYMGHSLVLHYTQGRVYYAPLWSMNQYKDEDMKKYISDHCNTRTSFFNYSGGKTGTYYGWCWAKNIKLGDAGDYTK